MSTTPPLPPKQDVATEVGRITSALTDDMQEAALKKARELGFDLNRGRLSLEETLINIRSIRDILSDAAVQGKLSQLPLKVQYSLYTQTSKVVETLNSIVNGTDAIQALEDVTEDLNASTWQTTCTISPKKSSAFTRR